MATQIKTAELIAKLDLFKAQSSKANLNKAFDMRHGLKGRDHNSGYIFELALEFIRVNSWSLRVEVFTISEGKLIKSDYMNLTTSKALKVKSWLKSNYANIF